MTKLSKKLLGLFLAICMLASLFTCLCGLTASAAGTTPDLVEFKGTDWTCMKYTKGWSTIQAGNYRFEMDCKITSGVPCIQVGADETGEALAAQSNYVETYDSVNYKYIITFTLIENWGGNLGAMVGNYGTGNRNNTTGDAVFACANPTLYLLDGSGNPTGSSLINTFASDYYSTSRTGNKWNRRNFSSSTATCTSPIPSGYFDPVGGEPGDYVGPQIDPETGEVIIPAHYHTGGTATCHSKAVCTVCGKEYGEFDANNHDGGTEVRDAVDATATEDGYTGDTYCLGCGALMAAGEVIPATGGGEPVQTSGNMIVWNGAPAYSRLLYRPDTGIFEAETKYVLSFDIELTDITEENEPFFWCVFYATEGGFSRIQHADFDITKTALKNGYHYDVKFTVPADCRDYNNILLKFGDTGANGYEQTMKLANLDLWSLDGSDNKVSQIELSIPATVDDIQQVTDTNQKSNGVHGAWVCPKDYLKNITVEPQNGYFDPISEPACEHANTSEVEAVASTCCTAGHAAYTVCDDCGEIISGSDEALPLDPDNHDGDTEVRDAKEATETEEGYTGDTYCLGCGAKIADGTVIPVKVTSTKMIHFAAGEDGWQTLVYKIPGTVAAGTYKVIIDEYAATDVKSTVKLFVNSTAYTTAVECNQDDLDTENNKRVVTFTLYGAKEDGMLLMIGNYGNGSNMETYYRNPRVYLVDGEGNPEGENLVADFAEDNIVFAYNTSRANAEFNKWTALNWTADRVILEDVKNSLFDGIDYTPGDINGDGEVDNKDLTRLFQFLSNWDVEVNEDALDVNGDGSVDNKDLTRLFQYLSNWDVEIF